MKTKNTDKEVKTVVLFDSRDAEDNEVLVDEFDYFADELMKTFDPDRYYVVVAKNIGWRGANGGKILKGSDIRTIWSGNYLKSLKFSDVDGVLTVNIWHHDCPVVPEEYKVMGLSAQASKWYQSHHPTPKAAVEYVCERETYTVRTYPARRIYKTARTGA